MNKPIYEYAHVCFDPCINVIFLNGPFLASFCLFSSFCTVQLLKNLGASRIQTRIVGAEGENADHYTTTTARVLLLNELAF